MCSTSKTTFLSIVCVSLLYLTTGCVAVESNHNINHHGISQKSAPAPKKPAKLKNVHNTQNIPPKNSPKNNKRIEAKLEPQPHSTPLKPTENQQHPKEPKIHNNKQIPPKHKNHPKYN